MFVFLRRRTDFYSVMQSPSDSKGFPPGVAEKMVLKSFRRSAPDSSQISSSLQPKALARETKQTGYISTWNGGVTPHYRWSQSIGDLTVQVILPEKMSTKSEISVVFKDSSVVVKFRNGIILEGDWTQRVNVSESTWVVEDGTSIIMSLEKSKEEWWESLLVGDAAIDTTKVESKKRIDQYHPDTQAAIRKILHDEHLKRTGQDSAALTKLKEAWDAEGSPFKGTPFDPSVLSPQSTIVPPH